MKKTHIFVLLILCVFAYSCVSTQYVQVKQEQSFKPDLSSYDTIHLGWIDYPVSKWREFGYKTQAEWEKVTYDLNKNGLKFRITSALPKKKILGPTSTSSIPKDGDLFIKFDYVSYEHGFNYGFGGIDRLNIKVEFYDIKTSNKIFEALLRIDGNIFGPEGHKGMILEGRIDLALKNLADFIAGKF